MHKQRQKRGFLRNCISSIGPYKLEALNIVEEPFDILLWKPGFMGIQSMYGWSQPIMHGGVKLQFSHHSKVGAFIKSSFDFI